MNHNTVIISDKNLEAVKYRMKVVLMDKYLPASPKDDEGWPIFTDYSSWVYRYYDFVEDNVHGENRISFKIKVVLKKQYHQLVNNCRFDFNVVCVYSGTKYEINVSKLTTRSKGFIG